MKHFKYEQIHIAEDLENELNEKGEYAFNFKMTFTKFTSYWQAKFIMVDTGEQRIVCGLQNINEEIIYRDLEALDSGVIFCTN